MKILWLTYNSVVTNLISKLCSALQFLILYNFPWYMLRIFMVHSKTFQFAIIIEDAKMTCVKIAKPITVWNIVSNWLNEELYPTVIFIILHLPCLWSSVYFIPLCTLSIKSYLRIYLFYFLYISLTSKAYSLSCWN